MAEQPKKGHRVATTADVKKRKYYRLGIGGGLVLRCRRVDLVSLFMEGVIPTPLLNAVDVVQNMRRQLGATGAAAGLANISRENVESMNEAVRRVAVLAVHAPKLTHSKAESRDKDWLWVGGVSDIPHDPDDDPNEPDIQMSDLMMVWRAVLGDSGVNILPDEDAQTFPQSESESATRDVPDLDRVRTEAVIVDSAAGAEGASTPVPSAEREAVGSI